jgi:hypothetical protein
VNSRLLTIDRGIEMPSRTARAGQGHCLRPGFATSWPMTTSRCSHASRKPTQLAAHTTSPFSRKAAPRLALNGWFVRRGRGTMATALRGRQGARR